MSTYLLLFLVFFPFLAAYFVYPLRKRGREYRNLYIRIIPGVELLAAGMLLLFSPGTAAMPQVCGLGLRFEAGSLHTMLAMLSAFLWLMTALPCKEYFADREGVNRYYCSWLMTLGALMGVFLAADLFTLFVFFEIMADNPVLTKEVRRRYETCYSGIFYRRFVLGEWAAAQGRIYDFFERETFCKAVPEGEMERWRVSADYGTANPTSFGLWGLRDGVWYRVKEYYYNSRVEGRQKTDAEYTEDLGRLIGGRSVETVVADPSAASFITALRQAGYPVEKADNNVLDGIRTTADALKSGRIVICEGCEDCLREMEAYCWESGSRDTPKKENDHAMPSGKLIGLDKGYALEQICAGDVLVEYDKLIDRQMERAAITSISGFAKLFTDAGKVLAI